MEVKNQNKLFRQKSLDRLEKLSSPEGIDNLVRVVSPQSWLLGISFSRPLAKVAQANSDWGR